MADDAGRGRFHEPHPAALIARGLVDSADNRHHLRMHIRLEEVAKRYGKTRALDGVNADLPPGRIVAVLGPNGAGKTTLLRCLAGIVAPDRGQVLMDGVPFRREDLDLRRRFMFLPDFPLLFWDRSVFRNLSLILRVYGADREGDLDRVTELLREFDLLALAGGAAGRPFQTRPPLNSESSATTAPISLASPGRRTPLRWPGPDRAAPRWVDRPGCAAAGARARPRVRNV